jgi:hypothetical protein
MTIKLTAQSDYVNNIKNFLPENPNSKTSASEKSTKLFNTIINSPNFIFDKNDKRITDYITTLISIRPGRTLFKRLLKADQPLTIVFGSKKEEPGYIADIRTIVLNDSKVRYCISANSEGEQFFTPMPDFLILAHELIHALHHFEGDLEYMAKLRNSKDILNSDLDNLEEQETIIGKEGEGTLCENVFRFHFGHPLRVSHRGIILNKGQSFTASTCAFAGTLASLKEMQFSELNRSEPLTGAAKELAWREMTPLHASLLANRVEISHYLIQTGVDVNAWDKGCGTALHLAVKNKQLDVVKALLEKGADINEKDPEGRTALMWADDEIATLLTSRLNLK